MKTENFVFFTKFEGKKNKVEELKQEIYTTIVFFSTNKKVKASWLLKSASKSKIN